MDDRQEVHKRMRYLMKPIDQQILMCDDPRDLLLMASCMLVYAKDIFDQELGINGRKKMFKELSE